MKTKLMPLSTKKNLIILLSIISLFLSKAFYYEVLQTSASIESELEKIFATLLASIIYLVIYKSILKLTNKKFLIYLFLHVAFMIFLSFCQDLEFHYRAFPFSTTLFCSETFIYISAILTPVCVENIHEHKISNPYRYLCMVAGYAIILWESSLSTSLKPALFHAIIFAFSWIYFMKEDKILSMLGALLSTSISALALESRFSASDYLLDTAKRFTQISGLWEHTESQLSAHIHEFGITDHTILYLIFSGLFLLIFVCLITYIVYNIRRTTGKQGIVICLCTWIIILVLQTLYLFGFLPFKFCYMFYGCWNYFLFCFNMILYKFN